MAETTNGQPPHDLSCLCIAELEEIAADKMDKQTRDYYNEGADSGSTLRENNEAYSKYRIRPRVLRDVSAIDMTTTVFGHRNSVPLGVAPTAVSLQPPPLSSMKSDSVSRCIAWHTLTANWLLRGRAATRTSSWA